MNKQNNVGSAFVDVPAPLNCLFLCKDSHWDVNQHIQPLIYFIGMTLLLLMSKNISLEVIVSHSWDFHLPVDTFPGGQKASCRKSDALQKLLMMLILV